MDSRRESNDARTSGKDDARGAAPEHLRRAMQGSSVAPHTAAAADDAEPVAVLRERFCGWLIAARESKGMTLDKIAEVTRIPLRSLERLESGEFERLPADVFVRGFLRSYARCVGLDIEGTIHRYAECGMTPAPVASPLASELAGTPTTITGEPTGRRATPPAGSDALPRSAFGRAATAPAGSGPVAAPARQEPAPSQTSQTDETRQPGERTATREPGPRRRKKRGKRKQQQQQQQRARNQASSQADQQASSQAASPGSDSAAPAAAETQGTGRSYATPENGTQAVPVARWPESGTDEVASAGSDPVSRPNRAMLVIDDDCPEAAAEVQESRMAEEKEREEQSWLDFLPPALLDPESGSRRGALTLAVIILVIVATLTMSYLLRRPSHFGDGVTRNESPARTLAVTSSQPGPLG